MAKSRGGGSVPQAGANVAFSTFNMDVGAGTVLADAEVDVGADPSPSLQAWVAKNPNGFRMVYSELTVSWADQPVEGSWGDGVTGQGFIRVVNAQGELLQQSETFDLVGID